MHFSFSSKDKDVKLHKSWNQPWLAVFTPQKSASTTHQAFFFFLFFSAEFVGKH